MNPLSPLTYYRRHKGQALLVLVLIGSLTLGVHATVSLTDNFLSLLRKFQGVKRLKSWLQISSVGFRNTGHLKSNYL